MAFVGGGGVDAAGVPPAVAGAFAPASPGALGGLRSLQLAQQLLLKLGCHLVPGQTMLPHADQAFDAGGRLTDARAQKSVQALATALVETTRRLSTAVT